MIYLTYNDGPSGIFRSQVVDTCDYLSHELETPTTLVTMISPRLKGDMTDMLEEYPTHKIINSWAGSSRWKLNSAFAIKAVRNTGEKSIIARGPIATKIALGWKKKGVIEKVCYDGRGAVWAESREFPDSHPLEPDVIKKMEQEAILDSDHRIAVSNALVDHWKEEFGYTGSNHTVIPCTLSRSRNVEAPINRQELRNKFGFSESDIVLVYAGSSAGWQSMRPLNNWLINIMKSDEQIKLLMLIPRLSDALTVFKEFPDRCKRDWVAPAEVRNNIACGDYGLLLRLPVITNKVSSPVKFAEYLDAGLKVIITPEIGDYSEYVKKENCGLTTDFNDTPKLEKVTRDEANHSFELSQRDFTKKANREKYERVLKALR